MIGKRFLMGFLQTDFLVRSNGPGSLGDNFLHVLPDLTTNKIANKSKSKLMIIWHPPMQSNKPVKALYTRAVWKIQQSGWGLVANTALNHAVFSTQHHPS